MIMQTSTSQNHTLGAYNLNIYFFSFKIYSKPTDFFLGIFEHTMNLKTSVKASITVFDLNSLPIYIDSFSQRLLQMLWAQYAHNKFTIQSVPRVSHIVHFTVTEQKDEKRNWDRSPPYCLANSRRRAWYIIAFAIWLKIRISWHRFAEKFHIREKKTLLDFQKRENWFACSIRQEYYNSVTLLPRWEVTQ